MRPTPDDVCERCGVEYREVRRYRDVHRTQRKCRIFYGSRPGPLLALRHRWHDRPRRRRLL